QLIDVGFAGIDWRADLRLYNRQLAAKQSRHIANLKLLPRSDRGIDGSRYQCGHRPAAPRIDCMGEDDPRQKLGSRPTSFHPHARSQLGDDSRSDAFVSDVNMRAGGRGKLDELRSLSRVGIATDALLSQDTVLGVGVA